MSGVFDLAIIGGGINGAGIARDAAGRGLRVLLLEQADLGAATSWASSKLIHGGLRYLEHYEFRLVREALAEREVLLRLAPHIIRPLRFVLPHDPATGRNWWLLRAGLFLYDHLGGRRTLPGSRALDLTDDPVGAPLRPGLRRGLEYADCQADDTRLVLLNAMDAAARGADIRPRTRCLAARPTDGGWAITAADGSESLARVLVNATGPWVSQARTGVIHGVPPAKAGVRMVKGSHIVTRRLFAHDRAYTFQNPDERVCFAIPWDGDFTLIGTTDEEYQGDPADATISPAEEAYLLAAVGAWLRRPPTASDIVWRFAGVRPLYDDGASKAQDATRDYVLDLAGTPPLLTIYGGKLTTYRRLAEAAMALLAPHFPALPAAWTATAPLPGGAVAPAVLRADLAARYPFLPAPTLDRLLGTHGSLLPQVLGDARTAADLGPVLAGDLTAREANWMVQREWARSAEDILWRRTRLGMRFPDIRPLAAFLAEPASR